MLVRQQCRFIEVSPLRVVAKTPRKRRETTYCPVARPRQFGSSVLQQPPATKCRYRQAPRTSARATAHVPWWHRPWHLWAGSSAARARLGPVATCRVCSWTWCWSQWPPWVADLCRTLNRPPSQSGHCVLQCRAEVEWAMARVAKRNQVVVVAVRYKRQHFGERRPRVA
jgi:hypothetical protein